MALFPAFADLSNDSKVEDSSKELEWLKNKSFQTGEALSLHNRFLEKTTERLSEKDSRLQDAPLASRFSWLDDLKSPTEQPFCVDSKPDPANWTYKSLYRGDVARYKRKGRSSLGLDPRRQEVSWDESESNKKQKGGDKKKAADRYFSTVSRQLLRSQHPVPTLPTIPECSDVVSPTSFLPLGDDDEGENKGGETGDRVQTSSVNPLGVYDSSTTLWLQGKGQQDQTEHQKQDKQTGQSANLLAGRTEEFNRRLREQPADTQLWIQFIQYQDELSATAFVGEEEQQGTDSAERRKSSYRAVLEKKLSIAERAVATNPGCIALQLERLRICQELWEPSQCHFLRQCGHSEKAISLFQAMIDFTFYKPESVQKMSTKQQ
eukprot:superscaffoldBa00007516_g22612